MRQPRVGMAKGWGGRGVECWNEMLRARLGARRRAAPTVATPGTLGGVGVRAAAAAATRSATSPLSHDHGARPAGGRTAWQAMRRHVGLDERAQDATPMSISRRVVCVWVCGGRVGGEGEGVKV